MKKEKILFRIAILLACTAAVLCLFGVTVTVHPSDASSSGDSQRADLSNRLLTYANNEKSDALSSLMYVKKLYMIDDSATCGEVPNPACYGTTTDPAVIEDVIAQAAELLDGQEVAWNRDRPIKTGSEMSWYLDDTIFVLTWLEAGEINTYYCSEIRIAHSSQFRRMLSGNTYGASQQLPCSEMAAAANAVFASNADFYAYREYGVNVYNGTLYRCKSSLENCFIDSEGNLLLTEKDELTTEAECLDYIEQNDISFSISFGPILIRDGVARTITSYPTGEVDTRANRAAIGQLDTLHYMIVTSTRANIREFISELSSLGLQTAYNLDGGQTEETIFMGVRFSKMMRSYERNVSDIIYFATAMPYEDSVQKYGSAASDAQ